MKNWSAAAINAWINTQLATAGTVSVELFFDAKGDLNGVTWA